MRRLSFICICICICMCICTCVCTCICICICIFTCICAYTFIFIRTGLAREPFLYKSVLIGVLPENAVRLRNWIELIGIEPEESVCTTITLLHYFVRIIRKCIERRWGAEGLKKVNFVVRTLLVPEMKAGKA